MVQTPVLATVLPPEADENQDLKIVTSFDVIGSMSQETALLWELSNEVLGANLIAVDNPENPNEYIYVLAPEPPLNEAGEVQSHVTYSEDTQANLGDVSYTKTSEVDTKALVGTQYNVWNERQILFTGIDGGTLLSSEDMMMYNVGTSLSATLSICPFTGNGEYNPTPAFCSKVETGSDLDMSKVAAYVAGGFRNVNEMGDPGEYPPIPSVDGAALTKYTVQITDMGQGTPSLGSVSAFLKISESDAGFYPDQNDLMQHLEVTDFKSIKGSINMFDYQINYESGIG